MKRILLSGATGFIGRSVADAFARRGDRVVALTRDPDAARRALPASAELVAWNAVEPPTAAMDGCDAVVHLAGEQAVGERWTEGKKRRILESRTQGTAALAAAVERCTRRPEVFVSASAVGYYGSHGDEPLDESASPGTDFLAQVTVEWERAALPVEQLGVRLVRARLGIVFGKGGGALAEMAMPFRLFAGGPIASGKQVVSWVHRDDVVSAFLRFVDDERFRGAINVTAPAAVTNEELAALIGRVLHRPSVFRVPEFALRLRFGEGADALVTGQRVVPRVLSDAGFTFAYPEAERAVREALG